MSIVVKHLGMQSEGREGLDYSRPEALEQSTSVSTVSYVHDAGSHHREEDYKGRKRQLRNTLQKNEVQTRL